MSQGEACFSLFDIIFQCEEIGVTEGGPCAVYSTVIVDDYFKSNLVGHELRFMVVGSAWLCKRCLTARWVYERDCSDYTV